MRICVTSTGKDLDAHIDPRFGRCPYFLYINTETMTTEVIQNESSLAAGGAGIQAAQRVAQANPQCVITGNIGPNAFQTLKAAGIQIITGACGMVKDIVEEYKSDHLKKTDAPTVETHFGRNSTKNDKGDKKQ